MTKPHLKVIRIMGRCNFNNACSEIHFNIFICNNRYFSMNDRQYQHFSNKMLIALIIWINCNSSIAKKCFRTCCSKLQITASVCKLIAQMPKMSCLILIFNLCVRKRRTAMRAPVYNSFSPVNQALFIIIYKGLLNSLGTAFVHCKAFS